MIISIHTTIPNVTKGTGESILNFSNTFDVALDINLTAVKCVTNTTIEFLPNNSTSVFLLIKRNRWEIFVDK